MTLRYLIKQMAQFSVKCLRIYTWGQGREREGRCRGRHNQRENVLSDKNMATNSRGNTTLTAFGIRQHLTTIGQSSNCTWPSLPLPLPLSVCLSRLWAALSVNFLLFIFVDSFFCVWRIFLRPGPHPLWHLPLVVFTCAFHFHFLPLVDIVFLRLCSPRPASPRPAFVSIKQIPLSAKACTWGASVGHFVNKD